tara:strand:+ start:259 stop:489 length:231 start_codon:yes stop_codon:yes gene_type:complete
MGCVIIRVSKGKVSMVTFELSGMMFMPPSPKCGVANCNKDAFYSYRKKESGKVSSVVTCMDHDAEDTLQIGLDLEG